MPKLPEWFKNSQGKNRASKKLAEKLDMQIPNCVCEEAKCPNRGECFSRGVITFLILGKSCTRKCGFCSVVKDGLRAPDKKEAVTILQTIAKLNLSYVVITSPTRDDLADGGAGHYAYVINQIKAKYSTLKTEVLVPDFQGNIDSLRTVVKAGPDVINHNLETVPALYDSVRQGADYLRSLKLIKTAKELAPYKLTKTGLMVGLGETKDQLLEVFQDIKKSNVDILTIGQYLKPTKNNLDVVKYYHPDEFEELKGQAEQAGIKYVFSGPFVRSSFLAETVFDGVVLGDGGIGMRDGGGHLGN
jgi:lipoyl synthase